ncbi:MAG: cupin domain-containing protein [Candidatus Thorarchaeota archaeon]
MSESWPKVWGRNEEIFRNDSVSVNFLTLVKGGVCSWHYHKHKSNKFYVISGKVLIKTEYNEVILGPGKVLVVPPLLEHQFEALEDSQMIEVMFVKYNNDDIIRIREGFLRKEAESE